MSPASLRAPLIAVLALLLPWLAARAQDATADRPPTTPTRDVDVVYETVHGGAGGAAQVMSQRMRWDAAQQLLRVDPPTGGLYMIIDYRAKQMLAVRESERAVIQMPAGSISGTPGIGRPGQFQRAGTDQVAGLACTDWNTRDSSGMATTVCLTDDGVLLRATSGNHILLQAASVIYGPLPPAIFAAPDGYRRIGPPQPEAPSQ